MNISEVTEHEEVDVLFLDEVYNGKGDFCSAIVKVDGHEILFKLDTGAAVTIVPDCQIRSRY